MKLQLITKPLKLVDRENNFYESAVLQKAYTLNPDNTISKSSYDNMKYMTPQKLEFNSYDELYEILDVLQHEKSIAVTIGSSKKHGVKQERKNINYDENYKSDILVLDIDDGYCEFDPFTQTDEYIEALMQYVKKLFKNFYSDCVIQLSNSVGLNDEDDKFFFKAHIFYILEEPQTANDIREFFLNPLNLRLNQKQLRKNPESKPFKFIDGSVAKMVQPIYISKPNFTNFEIPLENHIFYYRNNGKYLNLKTQITENKAINKKVQECRRLQKLASLLKPEQTYTTDVDKAIEAAERNANKHTDSYRAMLSFIGTCVSRGIKDEQFVKNKWFEFYKGNNYTLTTDSVWNKQWKKVNN